MQLKSQTQVKSWPFSTQQRTCCLFRLKYDIFVPSKTAFLLYIKAKHMQWRPLYSAFQRIILLYTDQLNFSPFDPVLTAWLTGLCCCVWTVCVCVSLRLILYTSTHSTLVLCLMELCSSLPLIWFHTCSKKSIIQAMFVCKCVCVLSVCY